VADAQTTNNSSSFDEFGSNDEEWNDDDLAAIDISVASVTKSARTKSDAARTGSSTQTILNSHTSNAKAYTAIQNSEVFRKFSCLMHDISSMDVEQTLLLW